MPKFIKKKCGRVTYYTPEGNQSFSLLVTEELDNGDLRLYFAGLTGSGAEKEGPDGEIPAIFNRMEEILKENGICDSVAELDFLKIECFGAAPKSPNPIADPEGYAAKRREIREAYQRAWVKFWSEKMPNKGLPARFTVYLEDLPNPKASYEICGIALLQRKEGKK